MIKINMKEAMNNIFSKHNYPIVKEFSSSTIATEKSSPTSVMNLDSVGSCFENIPFSISYHNRTCTRSVVTIDFLDKDGETILHVPTLSNSQNFDPDEKSNRLNYNFKINDSDIDKIAVAMIAEITRAGQTSKFVYCMSTPRSLRDILTLRKNKLSALYDKSVNERLNLVETLWK